MSQQYTCGHAPEVMCRECHPEAFDNNVRSPVYYHAECGCELRDDEKVKWCPYHVSGLQETINVRERELRELRDERNEWRSKAGLAERQVEEMRQVAYDMEEERDATIRILSEQKRILVSENRGLRRRQKELQKEADALQGAVKHLRDQIPDNDHDMSSNATMWKAKAERYDIERRDFKEWLDLADEKVAETQPATHWCCMHMRWETQEGAEV